MVARHSTEHGAPPYILGSVFQHGAYLNPQKDKIYTVRGNFLHLSDP